MCCNVRYLPIILSLFFSLQAHAGLSLSKAIIHFESDGTRSEDVIVFNQGTETLYVRIIPSLIRNPGTPEETREVYRDPRAAGLLVTPQRMVIPAGSRKRLRFVRLDDVELSTVDKVFRVVVKPEVGNIKATQTAVKIVVAYEALVLMQPTKARHKFEHSFKDKTLTITNTGNTNILLQKGYQCPQGQSKDDKNNQCVELTGKRLYAGNTWKIELPYLTPVTYQYLVGLETDIITFKLSKK